jgi:nitrite reductase/ring-hydroxylating ferredoxin subunit
MIESLPSGDGDRWVAVCASAAVGPGERIDAELGAGKADALDVVVWRSHGGTVCVMEARCPHQWSHLGAEGVVDGEEIVCASHFWRFDRTGRGTKVNVKGRRDPKADIAVVPARERDGVIEVRR